ncbi:putative type I restriction enzyme [Candidatus Brocadiaceae bacterium B188]|nr:restriction endonuclease subunit S [Candidatus Brocadia sapporoensis]QQR66841.1 MAG: restriction endonuclease subunit S [Candidatus Brocadia sp.]RZV57880.1 MAG: restriction endonuclease subunit S [Candidatus Brocadia sp. BROELEC01]TWU53816.1 putative type I restriction enzyme [Candidatus Brocadiaceae bacterium B188]
MKHCRWGDICTLEYGKALLDYSVESSEKDMFRVFGTNGPIGWTSTPLCRNDGIIIGRKGAYRGVHFSPEPFFVIDTAYYLRLATDDINLKWVYYKLLTVDINRMDVGAAIPTTNRNEFYALPLSVPSFDKQVKVSDILSAYDDLIDINRRRIQLLEEAARLLFREWFVYFRFPGHEKVKIVDGLPEGWKRRLLEDIAEVKKGRNITFEQAVEGDIPVVGGGLEPTYYHNKANVSAPVITVSASGANAGFVNLYDTDIWASDCSYIDKNSTKYVYYVYLGLKSLQTSIFGLQVGAAQPHVYPKDLNRLRVLIAPDDLCRQFEQLVTPIFDLIRTIKLENQKLAQARDLLLSRLMSGRIEV